MNIVHIWHSCAVGFMFSVLTLFVASLCRVAWLIGWALILEYTIGGSAVARGISPNLVSPIPASDVFMQILISS